MYLQPGDRHAALVSSLRRRVGGGDGNGLWSTLARKGSSENEDTPNLGADVRIGDRYGVAMLVVLALHTIGDLRILAYIAEGDATITPATFGN
jgi:hypothetical protein